MKNKIKRIKLSKFEKEVVKLQIKVDSLARKRNKIISYFRHKQKRLDVLYHSDKSDKEKIKGLIMEGTIDYILLLLQDEVYLDKKIMIAKDEDEKREKEKEYKRNW